MTLRLSGDEAVAVIIGLISHAKRKKMQKPKGPFFNGYTVSPGIPRIMHVGT